MGQRVSAAVVLICLLAVALLMLTRLPELCRYLGGVGSDERNVVARLLRILADATTLVSLLAVNDSA